MIHIYLTVVNDLTQMNETVPVYERLKIGIFDFCFYFVYLGMIAEEFVHFVWQFRLFNQLDLFGQDGEPIRILEVGIHNKDAGPDFLFAKIKIGETIWNGHVEMHVDGADWRKHGHHTDKAYNNVILHVVWVNPIAVSRADGTPIPCLYLQPLVDPGLRHRYEQIVQNLSWIPCSTEMRNIPDVVKVQTLQRMLVERLSLRFHQIYTLVEQFQGDWERILFVMLCRSFGMKVNAEIFFTLGTLIPVILIQRYADEPIKIEALFLGQAGFLGQHVEDDYLKKLQQEYAYLKQLHQLKEVDRFAWRFMRMRPYNFPTFRLAQLAALYAAYPLLFSQTMNVQDLDLFKKALSPVKASRFWCSHFGLEKSSSEHPTVLSEAFVEHLIINAFAPVVFSYGKYTDNIAFQEKALHWLEDIAPESNVITRKFKEIGLQAVSATESQAMLQLKTQYCDCKYCLQCPIGVYLMKT